ncbi:MAG: hypothetical protein ABIJ45_08635 [Candidatus Zixiibacteriota bacterium]
MNSKKTLQLLTAYKYMFRYKIDSILKILEGFEELSTSKQKQLDSLYNSFQNPISDAAIESLAAEKQEWKIILPRTLCEALLFLCYSILEKDMLQICDYYHKNKGTIALENLAKKGREKALIFLQEIMKVKITHSIATNEYISILNKIRNKLIHSDRTITDQGLLKRLVDISNKYNLSLITKENPSLELNEEFIRWAINNIILYFNELILDIEESNIEL